MIYASALRLVVLKFLLSMSASADVLALASLEVDLSFGPLLQSTRTLCFRSVLF